MPTMYQAEYAVMTVFALSRKLILFPMKISYNKLVLRTVK